MRIRTQCACVCTLNHKINPFEKIGICLTKLGGIQGVIHTENAQQFILQQDSASVAPSKSQELEDAEAACQNPRDGICRWSCFRFSKNRTRFSDESAEFGN